MMPPIQITPGEGLTIATTILGLAFHLGLFWARVSRIEEKLDDVTAAVEEAIGRPVLSRRRPAHAASRNR